MIDSVEFAIVSNNCWGGEVYKDFLRPYNTPFIGLFLPPLCYINLLKDFDTNIRSTLEFVKESKYEFYNEWRKKNMSYPIGLLNGIIEIHFMHYENRIEALNKWNRRVERLLNTKKIYFKFCDREISDENTISDFQNLPLLNKVCFTAKHFPQYDCTVFIQELVHLNQVIDGKALYVISKKYFDVKKWIKTGNGSLNFFQRINLALHLLRHGIKSYIKRAR